MRGSSSVGLAAADSTSVSSLAGILLVAERPLPSTKFAPVRSNPFLVRMSRTALTPPANDGSLPDLIAISRAIDSVRTLSEICIMLSTSCSIGADLISPSTCAPCGAVPTVAPEAPMRCANASAADWAGLPVRAETSFFGSSRPPSSMNGTIGATEPPAMSAVSHCGPSGSPVNRPRSNWTLLTAPFCLTWLTRSSSEAAPG